MKLPLSVYVIKHPCYSEGNEIARRIFSEVYREYDDATSVKSIVPVFFEDSSAEDCSRLHIDLTISEKTAVVLLFDDYMANAAANEWEVYFKELSSLVCNQCSIFIVLMRKELVKQIPPEMDRINCIRLYDYDSTSQTEQLIFVLKHEFCRIMLGVEPSGITTNQSVKLFLSHASADGKQLAVAISNYIQQRTSLHKFFDSIDIEPSRDFEKVIQENIDTTNILVSIKTDLYSQSEWCKKEILLAKDKDIPIIVIDFTIKGEARSFPYLGNTPVIRCRDTSDNSLLGVLSMVVSVALEIIAFQSFFTLNPPCSGIQVVHNPPELVTGLNLPDADSVYVYPEPPIGKFELSILQKAFPKRKYITPISLLSGITPSNLDPIRVGISIAGGREYGNTGITDAYCQALAVELARYLIHRNCVLSYGGNIDYKKNPNFTKSLLDIVVKYSKEYETKKQLVNYSAGYINDTINLTKVNDLAAAVKFIRTSKNHLWDAQEIPEPDRVHIAKAIDLSTMRREMNNNLDARIIASGKKVGFSGRFPGILEELYLALDSRLPVFLIGAFGGISSEITHCILGEDNIFTSGVFCQNQDKAFEEKCSKYILDNLTSEQLCKRIIDLTVDDLNNGLSAEENKRLFTSTNILEIVSLVLKGLETVPRK